MIYFITMDTYCKVLGHLTAFHRFYTNLLQGITEVNQFLGSIRLANGSAHEYY